MQNSKDSAAVHPENQRYLAFSLGAEHFAVPLLSVKEVVALPEMTRVPNTAAYFCGIMNLRGQIISVYDLRTRFGIKSEPSSENAVIIHNFPNLCFGVVVSSVDHVLSLAAGDIHEKPDFHDSQASAYITGVSHQGEKLVLLLDVVRALKLEELAASKERDVKSRNVA